jgi:mobilization protein NikA
VNNYIVEGRGNMPVYPVERTKKFDVYVSNKEYDMIKEMADREGLTYSEYIRVAVMYDAFMSGNKKAWKITFENASRKAKDFMNKRLFSVTSKLLGHDS